MILKHEGYIAEVGYEEGDALMHGSVVNARAVLHFAGRDINALKAAFAETVADYRAWCEERRAEPEKPYSGTLSLRLSPELHRRIPEQAAKAGASIDQYIAERERLEESTGCRCAWHEQSARGPSPLRGNERAGAGIYRVLAAFGFSAGIEKPLTASKLRNPVRPHPRCPYLSRNPTR